MIRPNADSLRRRCRSQAPWLTLGLGLWFTLVGIGNGAQNGSGNSNASSGRESLTTPAAPHDADTLPRGPAGTALTGTIFSTKSADARTIIADVHGRQRVYACGDEIADGGEVVEILRDYVVVRRGGRLETLEFSRNTSTRKFEGATQATPPEDYSKVLRHAMFTNPGLLLELVGTTAVVEGGHFRGYRVMQPKDPALLESLGLKPGDILTAVSGVPLDTSDYGAQVFDAMSSGGAELTFTVQRGARQVLVVGD